jgi:ATP synthase F1 gamma subunit
MPTVIDLKVELEDSKMLKFLSSAFTEASGARISKIRGAFEKNRQFYEEICHIYYLVKKSVEKVRQAEKSKVKSVIPLQNGKTALVAFTSNQHFYGNINSIIIRQFTHDAETKEADLLILGKTGRELLHSKRIGKKFEFIQFAKDSPDDTEINEFLKKVRDYDSVLVYFPKFVTLVTQKVEVLDITKFEKPDDKIKDEDINIIFEPELSKMIVFFTSQIQKVLFLRVILETDLSRTAARMISMSAAEERADKMIKDKNLELKKAQVGVMNRKLMETFAGMSKWK